MNNHFQNELPIAGSNPIAPEPQLVKNPAMQILKTSHVSQQRPAGAFMVLGVGSFAHSIGVALKDSGANVSTYLSRNYGHFPPTLVGKTFSQDAFPSPVPVIRENKVDFVTTALK